MAENDSLTITLTHQPPVRIKKSDWPIVAEARDDRATSEITSQSNTSTWRLTVRQHPDGRFIVYGIYRYRSRWSNDREYSVRGGQFYLAESDVDKIASTIVELAEWLQAQEHSGDDDRRWKTLVNECCADLPAKELA